MKSHPLCLFPLLLCVHVAVSSASAATLTVTSTFDDGGTGTLRSVVASAANGDIIQFATALNGRKIRLTSAVTINKILAIDASPLSGGVIVEGNGNSGVIRVDPAGNATLVGLIIQNGGSVSAGGGISVAGNLNAISCLVRNNTANNGAGVFVDVGATATLRDCTISGNHAFFNGGGLTFDGGGLNLVQCTIADNFAAGDAGGLHLKAALVSLNACSIADNRAGSGKGGGALVEANITLTDSIVGNNTAATTGPDIHRTAGTLTTSGKNLLGNLSDSSLTAGANVITGAPRLSPLAYYGGRTPTVHPLAGSPAIDAAGGSTPPGNDQRGFVRQNGVARDIGAVETGDVTLVTTNVDENGGSPATSLREAIAAAATQGGIIRFDPAVFNNATATTNTIFEVDAVGLRDLSVTGKSLFIDASNLTKGVTISGFNHNSACLVVDSASTLALHSMTVQRNSVGSSNGLIFNYGALTFINSLITGLNGNSSAYGALSQGQTGTGGARMVLRNSTVSGNQGNAQSASVIADGFNARSELILDHATVTANFNQNGSAVTNFNADVYLKNTVISGNTRVVGDLTNADYQRSGGDVSLRGRVIFGGNEPTLTGIANPTFRLIIAPPGLAPLGDNGGLTRSHLPLTGSAVLNASTESTRTTDQRGILTAGVADIGSVEAPVNAAPTISNITDQTILEDGTLSALAFTIGDTETAPGSLTVSGSSSNLTLVPNASITFGGSGASRTLSVTPVANLSGTATITVTVSDGVASTSDTFLLTVTAVNDVPSFTKGANVSVLNTAGAQTVTGWATALSAGPSDESTQTLSFTVSNNNTGLFSVQPAIAANGNLTFTPSSAANGTATISVQINDNGGTANGGVAQSTIQTFTITTTVPGAILVSSNANAGAGTLRQAFIDAAATAGANTIAFAPSFTGPVNLTAEISVTDTAPVTVDGSGVAGGVTLSVTGANRIFNLSSTSNNLTLRDLTLTGAASTGQGGAIRNDGTLALIRCTLTGNSATTGGAVRNTGTFTATQCTFTGNSAPGTGEDAGAIANTSGTSTLTHCTISGNSANDDGGGLRCSGGTLTLTHCIVAGNTAGGDGPDINRSSGTVTATGKNLIGDLTTSTLTAGTTVTVGNPLLAPLADYGGLTRTMALRPGSPARNAATGSTITTDQRGFPVVGTADLGAYEAGTLFTSFNAYLEETLPATATPAQRAGTFDFDGDGQSNQQEFLTGTAAESGSSAFLAEASRNGAGLLITFPTITGRTYTLETSTSLAAGSWVPDIFSARAGNGSAQSYSIAGTAANRLFFRVVVSQP